MWVLETFSKLLDSFRVALGGDFQYLNIQMFGGLTAELEYTVAGTKTYVAKTGEIDKQWWIADAEDQIIGRLASDIAVVLMGKHRPTYTPHVDTGDFVVVTNIDKLVFSGNKWEQKTYTWYTGYPGLRSETAASRFARKPEQVFRDAVRRMLPKNRIGRKMLGKLKLYAGTDHPHQAQNPQPFENRLAPAHAETQSETKS